MILWWVAIFVLSLAVLIKAADWFTKGAEIAGLKLKIKPFIIGVTIVSIGTSLPELVTSMIAVFNNEAAIVVANAVGSNIANILLIVGAASVLAGVLVVKRSLIDLDAPLLAISTAVLLGVIWDKQVTGFEATVLILTYIIYVAYTIKTGQTQGDEVEREDSKIKKEVKNNLKADEMPTNVAMSWHRTALLMLVGAVGIYFGADWVIKSVTELGGLLGTSSAVIAITAIAFGTSLPELVVSISAARKGNFEIALGNVFGSNMFNSLMVIGIPGLFTDLPIDPITYQVGIFFLIVATLLYIFSGISRRIYKWEGFMFLILYFLFIAKVIAGKL